MFIDIVIPTKGRVVKLENCVNSILRSSKNLNNVNLHIFFSIKSELDYFYNYLKNIKEIKLWTLNEYKVPDFWNGYLKIMKADAMMYLNDDILLFEDTIENIFKFYQQKFSNYDGIIGLNQSNLPDGQALESAFGVIGSKYADRFPNREVFCKDYNRFFADKELLLYAKSINKFYFCQQAKIIHFHPGFYKDFNDQTHKEVRQYLKQDRETFEKRQQLNYLWGKDFKLINKKENND